MDFRTVALALAPFIANARDLLAATDAVMQQTEQTTHDLLVGRALGSTEVIQFLRDGKKIAAIKELRTITSCGLKEAKDAVEDYRVDAYYCRPTSGW